MLIAFLTVYMQAEEVGVWEGTYSRPMTVPNLRPNTTYTCQAGMLVEVRQYKHISLLYAEFFYLKLFRRT